MALDTALEIPGTGSTVGDLESLGYSDSDILVMLGAGDPGFSAGSSSTAGGVAGGIISSIFSGLQRSGIFGQSAQSIALGVPPQGYTYTTAGKLVPATSVAGLSNPLILIGAIALGIAVLLAVSRGGG